VLGWPPEGEMTPSDSMARPLAVRRARPPLQGPLGPMPWRKKPFPVHQCPFVCALDCLWFCDE
jgi:hypothetical protein